MDSHFVQGAAGSVQSGSGSGGATPVSLPPVASVAGWNVLVQSEQTWLKQHLGSQLYTIALEPHLGQLIWTGAEVKPR